MHQIQKHKTNKLFYGEWPFKISTYIKNGNKLRQQSYFNYKNEHLLSFLFYKLSPKEKINLTKFIDKLNKIPTDQSKTRCEGPIYNIFIKNKELYLQTFNDLKEYIIAVWEPENEEEMNMLLDNKKIVIVDRYLHGLYTNKIIFKLMPEDVRLSLYHWLTRYPEEKIKISKTTKNYLTGSRKWAQDPFILVSDEKMVTMIALQCNEWIKRTEKFILRSNINTGS